MIERQEQIRIWLAGLFPQDELQQLQYIQSDASQRKYLRLITADSSFIVMDTTPDAEFFKFIKLAALLTKYNVNAPSILHHSSELGLILMSDLGSNSYLDLLNRSTPEKIHALYVAAFATLIKIQSIPTDPSKIFYTLSHMNAEYIDNRLEVYKTWYINTHMQAKQFYNADKILTKLQKLFYEAFAAVPAVFTHVDYHSRNLMVHANSNPGVIDFQDAMCGPITYDLVSLLQDAYITWPRQQVETWIHLYKEMAVDAGIIKPISTESLIYNFDLVGLHRHIKNLGVFARLHHRDNKAQYLNDIPTLLTYITDACSRYTELAWIARFIMEEVQV